MEHTLPIAEVDVRLKRVAHFVPLLPVLSTACISEELTIVAPAAEFDLVSTNTSHACGLTPDGVVACWSVSDPRPVVVSNMIEFASISTASNHTCGISTTGTAYCWGLNTFGQLGTLADTDTCNGGAPCSRTPIAVESDLVFTALEVGVSYACALDSDSFAHCWGDNRSGELGATSAFVCLSGFVEGGLPCSPDPLRVESGLRFASLSVGAHHTCGLTYEGKAYCWGAGSFGRLGNGAIENSSRPVEVAGDLTFRMISAGGRHTCGIAASEEVYCWGVNTDLQLGSIANDLSQECGRLPYRCVLVPTLVPGKLRFETVTAAVGGHTCGLSREGSVYCWGLNEFGALLIPNQLRSWKPVRIDVGRRFTQLSAGMFNTCGVTTESAVFCWPHGSPLAQWVVPDR